MKANRHPVDAVRRHVNAWRSSPAPFVLLRALVLQPTTETGHKPWRRRATYPARGAVRTVTGTTPGTGAS